MADAEPVERTPPYSWHLGCILPRELSKQIWALRAGALAAEAVMAGGHPLVLNRFSKKQAAASTGAMARVQKAQRVSFCDLAEITRGTYVRVTDGSEEQVRRTTAADALATHFSPCLLLGAERPGRR